LSVLKLFGLLKHLLKSVFRFLKILAWYSSSFNELYNVLTDWYHVFIFHCGLSIQNFNDNDICVLLPQLSSFQEPLCILYTTFTVTYHFKNNWMVQISFFLYFLSVLLWKIKLFFKCLMFICHIYRLSIWYEFIKNHHNGNTDVFNLEQLNIFCIYISLHSIFDWHKVYFYLFIILIASYLFIHVMKYVEIYVNSIRRKYYFSFFTFALKLSLAC